MDLVNAFELMFNRTDAVRFLWNLYIVVAFGLLGFLVKTSQGMQRMCIFAAAGFVVFAFSNLYALIQTRAERQGFVEVAREIGAVNYPALNQALWDLSPLGLIVLHLIIDITVVIFVIWLGRRKPGLE